MQLLLDPLESVSGGRSSSEGVFEIDGAGIEMHGIEGGEPADRASEIDRGIERFTAMTLQIKAQGETVGVATRPAPGAYRQDQGGEQDIVDPGVEGCGYGCQQRHRGFD